MSFDTFLHPERPESLNPHLAQGTIIGCVLGIITSIADPEGRGRVRVRAPIINPHEDLPSGEDNSNNGWIITTEQYTTNAVPGGSHRLLQVGTQVKVEPLYPANGRHWIVSDCVPSRVDPPHPDTNRANGTYGTVTLNGVFDVSNDDDQSRVYANPQGVVDFFSPEGDRLIQTEQGATMHLLQDGNARLENPNAFTHVSADGEVVQQSLGGARSILDEDGNVRISSAFATALRLLDSQSVLTGPLNSIANAVNRSSTFLRGHLGEARQVLRSLGSIAEELRLPVDLDSVDVALLEVDELLQDLQAGLAENLPAGMEPLAQLQEVSADELGILLTPQLSALEGITPAIAQVETLIDQGVSGQELATLALDLFPSDLTTRLQVDQVAPVLDALAHDPARQLEALLDEILPDGFEQIQNLMEMGVHRVIAPIRELLSAPLPDLIDDIPEEIERRVTEITRQLPENLRRLLSADQIRALVQDPSAGIERLLGELQRGMVSTALESLQEAIPLVGAVGPAQDLIRAISSGSTEQILSSAQQLAGAVGFEQLAELDLSDPQQILREAIAPLSERLAPILASGMEQVSQLANSIPDGVPGAVVRLTERFGEISDPNRINSIYAGVTGAGIRTPFGRFSFGAGGGSLFTAGRQMALLAGRAGVILHANGSASLSSLNGVAQDDDDRVSWVSENARVLVDESTIRLQSLRGDGESDHEIVVSPDGIYLNNYRITDLYDRMTLLERQLLVLQSLNSSPASSV